jgi:iron complex outermembrane receptor protein
MLGTIWTRSVLLTSTALVAGVIALPVTSAIGADAANAQAVQTDAGGGVEEIVVTAERRSTKLSKTPVAVTALTGATLEKQHIATEQDLPQAVPGLLVRQSINSNQINYVIRGQSLDAFSYTRPGVQPYFDEVQLPSTGVSSGFFDLDSVQVLKGPQGTLFGRNSTGGAVLFTTHKPENDFGGYVMGQYGSFDMERAEGAVNIPIVDDKVLFRLSGFQSRSSGYQYNQFYSNYNGAENRYGVRGSLSVHLGDFTNDLVVDYQYGAGRSVAGVVSAVDQFPGSFPTALLYSPATSDAVLTAILEGSGLPPAEAQAIANGNYARYIATHPGADPKGIFNVLANQQARGPYVADLLGKTPFHYWDTLMSDTATYDLNDDTTIKNIFGYVNEHSDTGEADGTPYGITNTNGKTVAQPTTSLSEELQVQGNLFSDLKYVAGYYYDYETLHYWNGSYNFDILPGGPSLEMFDYQRQNITNAVFAQGTYDLSQWTGVEGLGFTLGARYTHESVTLEHLPDDHAYGFATTGYVDSFGHVLLPASDFANNQSNSFNNVSWTVGIQEQFDQNLLAYFTARRSYKNGGFNGALAPRIGYADLSVTPGSSYRTETLTDVELGTKFNGQVFDHGVTFNLALFNDWIDQAQRVAYVDYNGVPSAVTVNVPSAQVYGFEADGTFNVNSWLKLGAALNYTYASFTNNIVNLAGHSEIYGTYPDTPRWSGDIYADVTIPVTQSIDGHIHGDLYGLTRTYYISTANLDPNAVLPGYATLNFQVGVEDYDQGWSVNVDIKNALDHTYYVGGLPLAQLLQIDTLVPGAPRTVMATVRYKFGGPSEPETAPAAYVPPPVQAPAPAPKSYLVFFDFNKSDLTPQAREIVDTAARNAETAKVTQLTVTGHTDTVGSDAYNMRLSRRRAESVASQLEKDGIAASEIEIVAKGKRDLLVPTADGVREPQNRRVQIVFDGAPGA